MTDVRTYHCPRCRHEQLFPVNATLDSRLCPACAKADGHLEVSMLPGKSPPTDPPKTIVRTLWLERVRVVIDDRPRRHRAVKAQNMLMPEDFLSPEDVNDLIADGVIVNIE